MTTLRNVCLAILFCFLSPCSLFSQSGARDSLTRLLEAHPERDLIRVGLLNSLAQKIYTSDPAATETIARESMSIARELKDSANLANTNNFVGISFFMRGELDSALVYSERSIRMGGLIGDTVNINSYYNTAGSIYARQGKLTLALDRFQRAFEGMMALGKQEEAGVVLINIGLINFQLGYYQRALDYSREALKITRETEMWTSYANTLNNIGVIYMEGFEDLDSALYYQNLALEKKHEFGMNSGLGAAYTNIAEIHILRKDYDLAAPFLKKAHEYALQSQNNTAYASNLQAEAKYWLGKNETDSALAKIHQAAEFVEGSTDLNILMKIRKVFAQVEESRGEYEQSLAHMKVFIGLKDSILDKEKSRMLAELEARYQFDKQKAENEELRENNAENEAIINRQSMVTWLIILGLLFLALIVFLLLRNLRQNQRSHQLLQMKNSLIEAKQNELQAKNEELAEFIREKDSLISIVAHDLKSPLAKVKGLAQLIPLSGDLNEEQASFLALIDKVSNDGGDLIRDLLDVSAAEQEGSEIVMSEFNLNGFLKDFLRGHEGPATDKGIQLHFKPLSGDLIFNSDRDFLTRIMDNLVSNAIKFSERGKNVWISSSIEGDSVTLAVRDEGPGISEEDQKKMFRKFQKLTARPTAGESSTGLGLSIIKSLVERMGGRVEVESELGTGTTFLIVLPRK